MPTAELVYNDDNKITKDYKEGIKEDVNSKQETSNQHLDQDNLCYRSPECKQANEGQQVEGKDNTASGFNDQSKNIEQPAASTTTSPTQGNGSTREQHHYLNCKQTRYL